MGESGGVTRSMEEELDIEDTLLRGELGKGDALRSIAGVRGCDKGKTGGTCLNDLPKPFRRLFR